MSKKNTDKRTATQRIEDLEKVLTNLYQAVMTHREAIEALAPVKEDMLLVKDAVKLIHKRVEAVVLAAKPETGITSESVSDLLVKMNVIDLINQVKTYVDSGTITLSESVEDNSFLVCEEIDSSGVVVNPRIQFRLDSQDAATQESLKGKKAGESVSFGDGKLTARVLEVYSITPQKVPEATDPEAPAAE